VAETTESEGPFPSVWGLCPSISQSTKITGEKKNDEALEEVTSGVSAPLSWPLCSSAGPRGSPPSLPDLPSPLQGMGPPADKALGQQGASASCTRSIGPGRGRGCHLCRTQRAFHSLLSRILGLRTPSSIPCPSRSAVRIRQGPFHLHLAFIIHLLPLGGRPRAVQPEAANNSLMRSNI